MDGAPGVFQIVSRAELLIVDGDDVLSIVTHEEGATGTVIDTFDSTVDVTSNVQAIAIIVTDGNQRRAFGVVAEMVRLTKRGQIYFRDCVESKSVPYFSKLNINYKLF